MDDLPLLGECKEGLGVFIGIGNGRGLLATRHVVRARTHCPDVVPIERGQELVEPAGRNDGVAVQEHDDVTAGFRRPVVTPPGEATILLVGDHLHPGVRSERLSGPIGRAVVHDHDLVRWAEGGTERLQHRRVWSQAFQAGMTMEAASRSVPWAGGSSSSLGGALHRFHGAHEGYNVPCWDGIEGWRQ